MPVRSLLIVGSFCLLSLASPAANGDDATLSFERDIRPILKAHCWHCHGEEPELQGGLDLRLARFLKKGGETGSSLVAGDHAASLLFQRIASGEMPPGEVKLPAEDLNRIARWIDAGATTLREEPESLPIGDVFAEEDRAHWSFQPIQRPAVPAISDLLSRTAIDQFIAKSLQAHNLSMSPEADRATQIRRLSFDLLGLPPTPEAVSAFVADERPDAYERLVDEMLDSPAYGERWARHWLDVVGYADSNGYTQDDGERLWAYKYRDYVIRSLNTDKAWNQFIVEQLAGDELVPPPLTNLSAEQVEYLVATGYLRMGPDGTGDGSVDQNVARNDVVAETVKIVSSSLLGLTVGCAQCHAHRYDPISHADYHRIRAVFEPAYDWKNWRAPNGRLVSAWSDETRKAVAEADAEIKAVSDARTAALDVIVNETLERELAKLPADIQPAARAAREAAEKDRTDEQKGLIKEYPFLNVNRGTVYLYQPDRLTGFNKEWDAKQEEAKAKRPADDLIQCLTEVPGKVPETHLFFRGDFNQPRDVVLPGELSIINRSNLELPADDPAVPTSGRRLNYARHLTSGEHPLVGRVLVNRIWLHHFGRGIVATPGDFGVLGEQPSHPELLDWLASEFIRTDWSLKKLQRLIVTSHVYRQSSRHRAELDAVDPENRLLGRMSVRRLEAEVIRDSLLAVSGRLSDKQFGRPTPVAPDEVGQVIVAADTRDSAGRPSNTVIPLGEDEFRRSLYVQVRRSMPLGVLEPFDMPTLAPNCEIRSRSTVAPQSLLMMNNEFVVAQAEAMAARVRQSTSDDAAAFSRAWFLALGREPTAEEQQDGVAFLAEQAALFQANPPPTDAKTKTPANPADLALATLCQALISSNGFLYVD
jgi:hypothetical protein